jgi:hypothetical protein
MRIGLDFDNTIVCYDQAIEILAEQTFRLPVELPRTKLALRGFLRQEGREPEWTAFQGALYGPGMQHAQPFSQAIETMLALQEQGHELVIVSHRSLRPYAGPAYDLHAAARGWVRDRLESQGLFKDGHVYFYETREAKIAAIGSLGCDVFLDDLPEVLGDAMFPSRTQGVLFDPDGASDGGRGPRTRRWQELERFLSKIR